MKQLKEDYERRLKTVMTELEKGGNDLTINRLGTKASCYRTFLTEINRALNIDLVSNRFACDGFKRCKEQCEDCKYYN